MQARGNLIWDSVMAENGILKVGRLTDFQAHQRMTAILCAAAAGPVTRRLEIRLTFPVMDVIFNVIEEER